MNYSRYVASAIALFVFIFAYELFVHGYLLMNQYEATESVWRNFDEMAANMPLAMCFQFALSAWTAFAFSQVYPEGGIAKGVLFGLFFGVFAGILTASWFLWLPVPAKLGWSWLASGIGEGLGGGLILGCVYRKA